MKTILLKAVCLLTFLSFTTLTKAQTKEETIAWLKEKLTNHVKCHDCKNLRLQRINECEVVFTYTYYRLHSSELREWQSVLPMSIKRISDGRFFYNSEIAYTKELGGSPFYDDISLLKLDNVEENIAARIEKAMKHLATFCPIKEETF